MTKADQLRAHSQIYKVETYYSSDRARHNVFVSWLVSSGQIPVKPHSFTSLMAERGFERERSIVTPGLKYVISDAEVERFVETLDAWIVMCRAEKL